ncbi:MAG TPA: Xaa-Pro dipeptidase [Polyangiaceae bacterium]|nr:Xaa-Pro dipeptidase [Polyangiaceae bacterium]
MLPEHEQELDRLYAGHVAQLERRYAEVLGDPRHGWDAVVLHSGSPVKRSAFDDQYWPLRPVPHWQHWLPLAEPECALVVRPGKRARLVLPATRSFWERPAPPPTQAFLTVFEVHRADDPSRVRDAIGGGRVAYIGEDAARAGSWGLEGDAFAPLALMRALDQLRVHKTAYEIACLVEANRRARAGHDALREAFRAGDASELDLHLLFLQATEQDDAETPYKNIVALGANAAILHHVAYGRRAEKREAESLLVDAGAGCRGYGADVTRTWVKGTGAAASVFGELVAGLEAMQQRLCGAVRVGRPYEELHDESHRQTADVLRAVGVVRGGVSTDEAVAAGITRSLYPHGLGHSLGLQTHDVGCGLKPPRPDNPFLRNTTDVAVGQVFTIEPGVYFIDDLTARLRAGPAASLVDWRVVDVLAPLGGVRIEDDVHVLWGDAGVRNLTREHLPRGGGSP